MKNDQKGTHFIRSVQYGGMLVGSLRIIASTKKDKQDIEAALNVGGGTPKLSVEVGIKFKKLNEDVKGLYRLEYRIFASSLLRTIPRNMTEFIDICLNFKRYADADAGPNGVPIQAELYPISSLKGCGKDPTSWIRNHELNGDLLDLEAKMDDTNDAFKTFHEWTDLIVDTKIKPQHKAKLNHYYNLLLKAKSAISECIDKLDISTTGNHEQFDKAIDAYAPNGNDLNNYKYRYELQELKRDIRKNGCDHFTGEVKYIGCYKDSSNRDLSNAYTDLKEASSVKLCASYCSSRGHSYCGLQFSSECYCGMTYGKYGTDAIGACDMPCNGNKHEKCGGSWRNSVWATDKGLGCPESFIKHRTESGDIFCYLFSSQINTWSDARTHCQNRGGENSDLASVSTSAEGQWISEQSRRMGETFWLGGRRTAAGSTTWEWLDDTRWSVTRWASGQPSNTNNRCLEMRSKDHQRHPNGHTWHAQQCSQKLGYVCKVAVSCTK